MTGKPKLEYNNVSMNWSAAQEFCVSKGGQLAPVASHWQKLLDFFADDDVGRFWLGGTDEAREGKWTRTDGSKWTMEHWMRDQPNEGQTV